MKKAFRFLAVGLCLAVAIGATVALGVNGNFEKAEAAKTANLAKTESYLVKDGLSDYVIVYPAKTQTSLIEVSVSELTLFFEKATGVRLVAKTDDSEDIYWRKSAKYISLGETEILTASGAGRDVDRKALKTTGYAIRNAGNSVFLIGGRENGVLNAVYRFLREQFNFECYAPDEIALDTNVRNAKLLDFKDVSETPDITFYGAAQTETMLNQIYARRLGMAQQADWIVELGGTFYHNWLGTIPKDDYQAAHPDWYSPSGTQLCLTRDADGLANEVFKKIVEVLQKNPSGYAIGFTQQDDGGWCTCDECTEVAKRYGANSATQILFMNKLWDLVEDWLKVNMPEREVYLYMFAYEYIAKHGVDYLFDEDRSGGARKMSDWSRLRFYLRAKLAWDTDADLLSYADAFFANYYKAAAKTMRQIFDEYSSHYAALIAEHHLRGQGGVIDILEPDFWPKGLLDRWMRLFDKAYEDIEFLKESDPALYSVLEERIRLDSVSLRYLCISLYGEDNCIYKGNGNTVAEDAKYFGMSYIG